MTFGVPDHIRSNYRTLLPPVEQAGLLQPTITTQLVCRDVLKQYSMAHLYIFFLMIVFHVFFWFPRRRGAVSDMHTSVIFYFYFQNKNTRIV
jgi:hypothetical protein